MRRAGALDRRGSPGKEKNSMKQYLTAAEVAEIVGVSLGKAYN